jgi:hypothetical protein
MKPFDYVVIVVSILIGLAIGDVTLSFHRLLRAGRRVRWHWGPPACALLAIAAVLRHFWVFWSIYHDLTSLTLIQFTPIIAVLILLFLATAAALPDEVPAEGIDLRAFYLSNRLHFWGLTTAWLAWLVIYNLIGRLRGGEPAPALTAVNLSAIALTASLIFVRRLWWHGLAIALLLAAVGVSWSRLTIR